jgi:multidrug efflux system membrane fusion protein
MKFFRLKILTWVFASLPVFLMACEKKVEEKAERSVVRPIKMMTVVSGQETLKRSFPGKVRASKRVDLAFQVSGPLIELSIEEGQGVEKDALLARIDPRDFKVRLRNEEGRLANAKASLKSMRQARPEDIRKFKAAVNKAKAALKLATAEYDRVMRIKTADPGAVSQGMIDTAVDKKERSEAELSRSGEDLRIAQRGARKEDIEAKEAEIKSLQASFDAAKLQLSYTYLKAPFSGVISRRYVDNFQEIRAKQSIMSLDDITSIEILVDVPEMVMATIKKEKANGAVAEFASAPGKKYSVTLKEYSTRADPKTQTYQIVMQMPQPDGVNVLPGMTATVSGNPNTARKGEESFFIPAIALVSDASGSANVWIVDKEGMTVQRRPVKAGELSGTDSIEILEGIKSGEIVAVSGVSRLREGMQVSDLSKMEGYKR